MLTPPSLVFLRGQAQKCHPLPDERKGSAFIPEPSIQREGNRVVLFHQGGDNEGEAGKRSRPFLAT